jgi:hypothetical protein
MLNFLNGHQIATVWFFAGDITKKLHEVILSLRQLGIDFLKH